MKIKLVDLQVQYQKIRKEIDEAISSVIQKSNFIMGEEVEKFEQAFAKFIEAKYAIGVSSGTDALHLGLLALGIGKDDEIILPAHSFTATAEPVVWLGAKPVFVDIDEKTYNLNPAKIEEKITKKTKGIIPVHLYGQPADMNSIMTIAKKYKLFVLEDCAQAHGAKIKLKSGKWKKVGTIGDAGIFSFYPGKNLGAYGDAGIVVTNNKELAKKVRFLRNHGRKEKYMHKIIGYGDRLDTLHAAILLAKLRYLNFWNKKRREKVKLYNNLLNGIKEVITPYEVFWAFSVYHLYVIRAKKRGSLQVYLSKRGIETGIHYPLPLHLQPAYKFLGYKKGDLPVTEKISQEVISLPLFPEIKDKQIKYICQCIKEFYTS